MLDAAFIDSSKGGITISGSLSCTFFTLCFFLFFHYIPLLWSKESAIASLGHIGIKRGMVIVMF